MPGGAPSIRDLVGAGMIGGGFVPESPMRSAVVIATGLWLVGFASQVQQVIQLDHQLGLWALVAAGLLLILGSVTQVL